MCAKSSLMLIALVIFFLIAATPPSATAAPAADACLLLTPAELSSVLGVQMAAGQHTTPTYLKTCTWTPSGGSTKALKFVTLNLESADGYEAGKNMMKQMQSKNMTFTPATGIGDDAFYTIFGSNITSLIAKKGKVSFKLAFYGETVPEKVMAMEKTLALQFISKL
jgi:hypothetical protein